MADRDSGRTAQAAASHQGNLGAALELRPNGRRTLTLDDLDLGVAHVGRHRSMVRQVNLARMFLHYWRHGFGSPEYSPWTDLKPARASNPSRQNVPAGASAAASRRWRRLAAYRSARSLIQLKLRLDRPNDSIEGRPGRLIVGGPFHRPIRSSVQRLECGDFVCPAFARQRGCECRVIMDQRPNPCFDITLTSSKGMQFILLLKVAGDLV
jgi:hypothetical protein